METKKRALGMGLEQLFNGENLDLDQMEKTIYENSTNEEIVELNLDEFVTGNNISYTTDDEIKYPFVFKTSTTNEEVIYIATMKYSEVYGGFITTFELEKEEKKCWRKKI